MDIKENNLLKIFFNTIQNHSNSYGDNCKSLFFYIFISLNLLENRKSEEKDELLSYFTHKSMYPLNSSVSHTSTKVYYLKFQSL